MRLRSLHIFLAPIFIIGMILLSGALPASAYSFKRPIESVSRKVSSSNRTAFATTQTNLPYPSWWNGTTCDTSKVSNSTPLGSYYRGVPACGPIGLPVDDAHKVIFPNGFGEYEWQCVELSMRFMYLAYGTPAYDAPTGTDVVDNYLLHNSNPVLVPIQNTNPPSTDTVPQPGDILSYYANHTSVVWKTNVKDGNGTLTVIEQNFHSKGTDTINVGSNAGLPAYVLDTSKIKNWLHHTVDLIPQTAPPSSTVKVTATGFTASEKVNIYFHDGTQTTLLATSTASSSGTLSTSINIPLTASLGAHSIDLQGQISGIDPKTVLYVQNPSSPQLGISPSSGPPTSKINVTGTGFGATENITLSFDTTQIGTATTFSNGAFSSMITVPSLASSGTHTVQATGQTSGLMAQVSFQVQIDWPTFGFNPQHTHYNPYEHILNSTNVSNMVLDWTDNVPQQIYEDPVLAVANNIVYVATQDGNGAVAGTLYALDTTTGATIWTYPTGGRIFSSPAVYNGIVYVDDENGTISAINATTGVLIWKYVTKDTLHGSPTVVNGIVYVDTVFGYFYALKANNGSLLWVNTLGGDTWSTPAVSGGIIYIGLLNGPLEALDAKTGNPLWYGLISSGGSSASATVMNGIVYINSFSMTNPYPAKLYAFNASGCGSASCSPLWTASVGNDGGYNMPSPTVANGVVYFGSVSGTLYAFKAKTGALLWSANTGGSLQTPVIANGVVYAPWIGSSGNQPIGMMLAYNASGCGSTSCSPLWSYILGNVSPDTSPVVINGVVYGVAFNPVSPYNSTIYALHLSGT